MFTFLWAQVLELGFYLPEPNVAILSFSFRKFEFLRRAIKFLLSHFERYLCICQASKHYWCWRRRCLFADIWESHPLEAAYWHMRIIYLNTVTITNSQFDTPRECLIETKPLNNILFCQNKSRNICSNAFHSLNTFSNWLLNMWRNKEKIWFFKRQIKHQTFLKFFREIPHQQKSFSGAKNKKKLRLLIEQKRTNSTSETGWKYIHFQPSILWSAPDMDTKWMVVQLHVWKANINSMPELIGYMMFANKKKESKNVSGTYEKRKNMVVQRILLTLLLAYLVVVHCYGNSHRCF